MCGCGVLVYGDIVSIHVPLRSSLGRSPSSLRSSCIYPSAKVDNKEKEESVQCAKCSIQHVCVE